MFDVKDIPLAKYTRNEDIANCITHALGIPFCIVALILLVRLEAGRAPAIRIFAGILYIVSTLIVFTGSAIYHGLKPSRAKQIARIIDHSNIFFMIGGVVTSFAIADVTAENRTKSLLVIAAVWVICIIGILLGFIDFKKFAIPQIFMYVITGWITIFNMRSVWHSGETGRRFVMTMLVGGIVITLGTVLYLFGKKHRYFHAVFHVFVLAGCVVVFIGVYNYNAALLVM